MTTSVPLKKSNVSKNRHCEERNDEAISIKKSGIASPSARNDKKRARNDKFFYELQAELERVRQENLYRETRVLGEKKEILNFADNDYLGLSRHARVIQALTRAAKKYGAGAGAARLLSGTSAEHSALEKELAAFKGQKKVLVFGSGYAANLGALSAFAGPEDLLLLDKLNHASIIDAARLSGAEFRVYPHKNLKRLEELLKPAGNYRRCIIVTDSVFSMDGDLAPLAEIAALKEKYGALLMIDEAHGTGVFGKRGRGLAEHLGVEKKIDIHMGTLSKAVGVMGGFVAGSAPLIDSLVNFSRPFIFATALPAALMAAARESLRVIRKEPELRRKLWRNVEQARRELTASGWDIGESASPIIPILLGDEAKALRLSKKLLEKGIYIPAVRYPAVGRGKARLRLTLSARHTPAQLERLFAALRKARQGL